MSLVKANLLVNLAGKTRRLAAIRQNSKGDVYVSFFGVRKGDELDGPEIREQRISIHPSRASNGTSTIKYQLLTKSGELLDRVSATSATRSFSDGLFFPVIFYRMSNLESSVYDWTEKPNKKETWYNWGDYNPSQFTLFLSFIVGTPRYKFPADDCVCIDTGGFQLVFFVDSVNFPALLHSHFFLTVTSPPERMSNRFTRRAMADIVRGATPDEIQKIKRFSVARLALNQIQTARSFYGVPDLDELEQTATREAIETETHLSDHMRLLLLGTDQDQQEFSVVRTLAEDITPGSQPIKSPSQE